MWATPLPLKVVRILNEITMSPEAFLVVLGLAVLFGAKYVAMIISAIISVVQLCSLLCTVKHVYLVKEGDK